ncbi:hypothetical protein cauri_1973 [Corynebacterium aurimucosum ATCC 700975]|uniref:GP-PDE domain-containing protein n=2 Tax=Corynebacterium aurimucosum TaxID=169292 RepID=C3PIB2_CORA7|nr:hypothetical protein cauri_1973 [Corynebacterium aurimucosum ATCC 700975]
MMRTPGGDREMQLWRRTQGGDIPMVLGQVGDDSQGDTPNPNPVAEPGVKGFLKTRPFYMAHRFGGTEYPEMTKVGLQASIDAGFRCYEFSTYRTKDGVYIGSHDWTTKRTTGVKHEIWNTDWATIKTLKQETGPFMRLEEVVEMMPEGTVLALDHKTTSAGINTNPDDLASEEALFKKLEELFDDPTERVIWKLFSGSDSAERAKARGYTVMCMVYENELDAADLSRWDILGLEWNATQAGWDRLKAAGKPTIAHIITSASQARVALDKGADGLMSSVPSTVHP